MISIMDTFICGESSDIRTLFDREFPKPSKRSGFCPFLTISLPISYSSNGRCGSERSCGHKRDFIDIRRVHSRFNVPIVSCLHGYYILYT